MVGGGSAGLGLAVARALVGRGARVLLVARDLDRLEAAAAELGPGAQTAVADLADPEEGARVGGLAAVLLGGVDGALVNAGGPPAGSALELDDADWQRAYGLLVGAPVAFVRSLVPLLPDGGSILFVTSTAVRRPIAGLDASNVLRPATAALVECLARELAPAVRVNAIEPGRFDTDRVRALDARRAEAAGTAVEEERARSQAGIPLGRYGDPAELAELAAWLLSPASGYVTGASFRVDGGLTTATG